MSVVYRTSSHFISSLGAILEAIDCSHKLGFAKRNAAKIWVFQELRESCQGRVSPNWAEVIAVIA